MSANTLMIHMLYDFDSEEGCPDPGLLRALSWYEYEAGSFVHIHVGKTDSNQSSRVPIDGSSAAVVMEVPSWEVMIGTFWSCMNKAANTPSAYWYSGWATAELDLPYLVNFGLAAGIGIDPLFISNPRYQYSTVDVCRDAKRVFAQGSYDLKKKDVEPSSVLRMWRAPSFTGEDHIPDSEILDKKKSSRRPSWNKKGWYPILDRLYGLRDILERTNGRFKLL